MKKLLVLTLMLFAAVSCVLLSSCAHSHTWGEWEIMENPTCTQSGLQKRVCKCGTEEIVNIDPLGHAAGDEATCTTDQKCLTCDATLVSAEGHKAGSEATCTTAQVCTVCNAELVAALGHAESEWIVDLEPTCTEEGAKHKTCSTCDATTKTEVIAAKGHSSVVDKAKAATCTETGLTEGSHCSVCQAILVEQHVVAVLGHDWVTDKYVAPTCAKTGLTEGSHCARCKDVRVAQKQIEKLEHTLVVDAAVAPTCTEAGITEGSHCSSCQKIIVAQKVIEATGHPFDMKTNRCSVCSEKEYTFEITNQETYEWYKNKKGIIFFLDSYIDPSAATSPEQVFNVSADTDYIRFVGNTEREFNFRVVVNKRSTPLTIDFVDVTMVSQQSIVSSESSAEISIGFYGDACVLLCTKANDGADSKLLGTGKIDGSNGSSAIDVKGPLNVLFAAKDIRIAGGDGGKGGNGRDHWGQAGENGGKGGDGGYAISAETIVAKYGKGITSDNIILRGGAGAEGGKGGESIPMDGGIFGGWIDIYPDGEDGKPGDDSIATNVEIVYQ